MFGKLLHVHIHYLIPSTKKIFIRRRLIFANFAVNFIMLIFYSRGFGEKLFHVYQLAQKNVFS